MVEVTEEMVKAGIAELDAFFEQEHYFEYGWPNKTVSEDFVKRIYLAMRADSPVSQQQDDPPYDDNDSRCPVARAVLE